MLLARGAWSTREDQDAADLPGLGTWVAGPALSQEEDRKGQSLGWIQLGSPCSVKCRHPEIVQVPVQTAAIKRIAQ